VSNEYPSRNDVTACAVPPSFALAWKLTLKRLRSVNIIAGSASDVDTENECSSTQKATMSTTEDKIKEIEAEVSRSGWCQDLGATLAVAQMARTQKNKATAKHVGQLKARLAKLKTELVSGGVSERAAAGRRGAAIGGARRKEAEALAMGSMCPRAETREWGWWASRRWGRAHC
jgi:hypothetical protein